MTKSRLLKFSYTFQRNSIWRYFLFILSWVFLCLIVLEPTYKGDISIKKGTNSFIILYTLESIILMSFTTDLILEITHRSYNDSKTFFQKFIKNKKFICKFLSIFCCICDCFYFYFSFPNSLRFSRMLRPSNLIFIYCSFYKKI